MAMPAKKKRTISKDAKKTINKVSDKVGKKK